MESEHPLAAADFLNGGGDAGRLIATGDWSKTSIGPLDRWPQSLKTATAILLRWPVPIVMLWGEDGVMLYNDAYSLFAGNRHPELLGSKVREGWPEVADFNDNVMRVGLAGKTLQYRDQELTLYRFGRPEQVWMNLDYSPVLNESGAPAGVICILAETTEKLAAENALRASEARLRDLNGSLAAQVEERSAERDRTWNNSRDMLLILDDAGIIQAVNPAWTAVLGWEEHELVGQSYQEFVLPDDHAPSAQALETASKTFLPAFENHYRHKDGSMRTISWVAAPEDRMVYASGRDVTAERKVAEELLLHRNIVQSNPNPIMAFDHDLFVTAFNQAHVDKFLETQGVLSEIGHRFPDHFIPEERPSITALMERALTGELFVSRAEFGDPDHARLHWDLHYSPLRDANGAITGASHHAIDVTAQVAAEQALAESQEALRQAQKMEAVGQLTGGLAHDFNNLLTGIMGNLELLQMRIARGRLDDIDRFITAAQGAGRRAAALTQRLLAFSRRQTLDPRPTDVNRLAMGMEDMLRRTMGPAHVLKVVGADDLWPANIDAGQLENALLNLCINARDAMPDGGNLTIETANKRLDDRAARQNDLPPGEYLSICVTDTGTGMDAETIERAFEPFFTTKPIGQGTGLGLSMVYGFSRQSNGQIRIYSEPGLGTTVCLYLPRYLGAADDIVPEPKAGSIPDAAAGSVLVVDDEETIRQLVKEVLAEIGYTVVSAPDGAAGIKLLQSGVPVDLLITDVGLPGGMNGRQVADAARALRPGLKVLFITGYAENAAVGNGHLDPGMELLTKPFSLDALVAKVRDIIVPSAS